MKSPKIYFFLSIITLVAVLAVSCSKKMDPLTGSLFSVNPSPLELVGTKVPVTVNGKFPAKWFEKNTSIIVSPVLKYAGQETVGASQTYQGEKVAGNGIVISNKDGGPITLVSSFDYKPAMKKSELYLRFTVSRKGKIIPAFPDVKIADGIVASSALASAYTVAPAVAPDAFQRIIKETYDADILFLIQQAELRTSELNSSNMTAWQNLVKEASESNRKTLNVEITAYASPDGGLELNEKLAEKREKNTSGYLDKEFKKKNIDTEINAKYTAQDWDGFQKLVQASSLQDKDLVLRVLSMYPDAETREKEVKNISIVYSDLASTILPQLRRSRLSANVEIIGKTTQELQDALASNDLKGLSIEELLYAATLDGVSKEKAYLAATAQFPNDYRGWNNLGAYYYQKGQIDKAKQAFTKAGQTSNAAAEVKMNSGLLALMNGETAKAEQLLGSAAGASSLNEALGLLYIQKGEYSKAVQSFGDNKSNNAALAQLLTKNYSKAQQIVDAIPNKDATAYYLAALVAARTNNASGVAGNLKSALDKGASAADILNDVEFAKFLSNPDIKNMLFK